jgi:hypothetical protein
MEAKMRVNRLIIPFLAVLFLLPAAALAQEELDCERPEPGFRVLGPRTVVSFVRQSHPVPEVEPLEDPNAPLPEPRWNTVLHVSNTGNVPMGAVAAFINHEGLPAGHLRFPVQPGKTVTVPVIALLENATDPAPTDETATAEMEPIARGIVILRFFAPSDTTAGAKFSQMVTAETVLEIPGRTPVIFPLEVGQPQSLFAPRRLRR